MRWRVLLWPCLLLVACQEAKIVDATQVTVVIDADEELKNKKHLALIEVDVLDEAGKSSVSKHSFALADTPLPLSFGIYRPPGGAEWFMLRTRGLDEDEKELVAHEAIDHFEPNKNREIHIELSILCLNKFCDALEGQTCNSQTGECEVILREEDAGRVILEEDGGPTDGGPQPQPVRDGGIDSGTMDGGRDRCTLGRSQIPCAL
jgi:hypothetical protein